MSMDRWWSPGQEVWVWEVYRNWKHLTLILEWDNQPQPVSQIRRTGIFNFCCAYVYVNNKTWTKEKGKGERENIGPQHVVTNSKLNKPKSNSNSVTEG